MMKYINVATISTAKALDRLFTYAVPPALNAEVEIGSIVQIPFGRRNTVQKAFVIETEVEKPEAEFELKQILSVSGEHFLTPEQIELALWMKQYYVATLASVIKLMLPPSFQVRSKKQISYYLKADAKQIDTYCQKLRNGKYQKRLDLLEYFMSVHGRELPPLSEQSFYSKGILDTLVKDGIIGCREIVASALSPYLQDTEIKIEPIDLNTEQLAVYSAIKNDFHGIHLIHGVTGSGKTEVYFKLIEDVLSQGKTAIVLLPEIALTFALVRRFLQRFGQIIGLFHSRLSEGEKLAEWERARKGESRIMIGPRSALFAPIRNLGLIIVDEEHESSYKSDFMPKFQTTEVAAKMGKIYDIPVILGSATPAVESYYYALNQRFRLHNLNHKALNNWPLMVEVIDMRRELEAGNRSFLSMALEKAIIEALERKEQVILLNNRRGYAKFVSCRKCGFVYKCPHCEMPMTYHKEPVMMVCHHCGYQKTMQKICPECESPYLKAFGMGTQKIESELKKKFPEVSIIRMDYDTTRSKHGHDKKLQEFAKAESGILVGTQMIAKGLDFHNVTVVGVLAVDQGLYTDDFRASERTFQLLTQVIGRTGRGNKPGRAFLQSYSPEHFAIQAGMKQDYQAFYQEEIVYRKLLKNPPYCEILEIMVAHGSENELTIMIKELAKELKQLIERNKWEIEVLGPSTPYLFKIADTYRKIILLKANRHKELTFLMKYLYNKKVEKSGFTLYLDINPQFLN
ncbi:primosomal protein N' [Clostridiales bacterium COT073_COT-073]|nr:primosomal protein N' [Clostridiales bacterium COT073_COT-073]